MGGIRGGERENFFKCGLRCLRFSQYKELKSIQAFHFLARSECHEGIEGQRDTLAVLE